MREDYGCHRNNQNKLRLNTTGVSTHAHNPVWMADVVATGFNPLMICFIVIGRKAG